jgi:hypothetical protein
MMIKAQSFAELVASWLNSGQIHRVADPAEAEALGIAAYAGAVYYPPAPSDVAGVDSTADAICISSQCGRFLLRVSVPQAGRYNLVVYQGSPEAIATVQRLTILPACIPAPQGEACSFHAL